jgi:transposase
MWLAAAHQDLVIPTNRGKSVLVIGALSNYYGLMHHIVTDEPNTTINFVRFFEQLAKKFNGQLTTVVMDNLRQHHCNQIKELSNTKNVELLYTPAYSCELNAIETLWGRVKNLWQKFLIQNEGKPMKTDDIIQKIDEILKNLCKETCISMSRSHFKAMLKSIRKGEIV